MDRLLIDYLPPVLAETREMGAVMAAEQPEMETAWDMWRQVLHNAFVQTADARGLARWEKIIGILPKGRDSLEQRRRQIMLRLNEKLPFTYKALSDMLTAVFGADGYVLEVDPLAYRLLVTLPVDMDGGLNLRGLPGLLARVVPVNMIYRMRAEMKEYLDAQAHFLLRRFGIRAAVNLFGVQTIYFDGARTFDGSWPFSPVFTRGASFKTFMMDTRHSVLQKIKPGILLGGFAAVHGTGTMRQMALWTGAECRKRFCVPAMHFQHRKYACPGIAASVTKNTMWRLDGGYLLNGARRLNAAVIKTTL